MTKEDSDMKHKRNGILTGYSFLALFTLGVGSIAIKKESKRERQIRHLNKDLYPNLPYHACVLLRDHEWVIYNGVKYNNPHYARDVKKAERRAYNEAHPDEVAAAEYLRMRKIYSERTGGEFGI